MAAMWSPIIGLILLLLPLAPSSSSYIYPLGGKVYPTGYFHVEMKIGKPPKDYKLDIDTGSNLTWLECEHPVYGRGGCTPGLRYYYKPKLDGNLKMECKDPFCVALRADLPGRNPKCDVPQQCHYATEYIDGKTEGVLSNDTISLGVRKGSTNIVFGCGYKQIPALRMQPPNTEIQGVLGLGAGRAGFVAQLKDQKLITKNIVAHCLRKSGGGYLFIGGYVPPPTRKITWAPMKKNVLHYSPGQATVYLDGQKIYAHGVSAVFDSGATYTYMPARIYGPLVEKVKDVLGDILGLQPVHDPALPQCWTFKNPFEPIDKPLRLSFDNKVGMTIPSSNYLVRTKRNIVCLGFLNGTQIGEDKMIIIGDTFMQDMLVVYDNERGMIGWGDSPCTKSTTTSRL